MPDADITLDGENCIVDGNFLLVHCLDLKLDSPSRRSSASGERRALVHGFNDELVLNWAKDYPGGVVSHGNFEIQKNGQLRMRNNAGNVTVRLDGGLGDIQIGGPGAAGNIVCQDGDGTRIFDFNSGLKRMDVADDAGFIRVCLKVDDFTDSEWPAWPGESVRYRLDLIAEIRRLKEELIALREQVDALSG